MSRRYGLAVDLMSNEALWDRLYSHSIRLEEGLNGSMQRQDRSQKIREVRLIVQELRMRGIQLSFHWE